MPDASGAPTASRPSRCASSTCTGRARRCRTRTPGVLAIFASRLLNDARAADLRGRPPAARLRQRPRRRARLRLALETRRGGRAGVQRRQRPVVHGARDRASAWPRRWAARTSRRRSPASTGWATCATASPTSRRARQAARLRAAGLLRGRAARSLPPGCATDRRRDRVAEARARARRAGAHAMSAGTAQPTRARPSHHGRRGLHRRQRRRPAALSAASASSLFDNLSRAGVERNLAWLRATPRRPRRARGRRRARRGRGAPRGRSGRRHVFHFAAQVAVTTSLVDPVARLRGQRARHAQRAGGDARAEQPAVAALHVDQQGLRRAAPTWRCSVRGGRYEPVDPRILRARHRRARGRSTSTAPTAARRDAPISTCSTTRASTASAPRVPHELHLRPAPVRNGGPGLGRALPASARSAASRSRSTATGCRCATCSSSTIWSTRSLRVARRHRRRLAGRAFNIGGGPAQRRQPARAARRDRGAERRPARAALRGRGGRATSATTCPTSRKLRRGDRLAPRVGVRARASDRLDAWLREALAGAAPSRAPRRGAAVTPVKVALVNPPWSFDGSIYFGCREPHLPLEYGYAQALLERAGHEAQIVDAQLDGLTLRGRPRARSRRSQPDMTVVTTAPSYLFWRCAPPELRVPLETLAALRERRRPITVAVGPHASTTPARRAAQAGRRRRR